MKNILFILGMLISALQLSAEEINVIDKELDERIEVNKQYKTEFTEEARHSANAKELVPLEQQNGQDWVDMIITVRNSDDMQLKLYVLRIELQTELIGYLYDLEYAESIGEKAEAIREIQKYQQKLEAVKAFEKEWKEKK